MARKKGANDPQGMVENEMSEVLIDIGSKVLEAICPPSRMELILSRDLLKETIDVRPATVLEANPERIILSQTNPPIASAMVGEEIEATFLMLDPATGTRKRWGYFTPILGVLSDYNPPGKKVSDPAIVIGPPSASLQEANLRFHHRLQILPEHQVAVDMPTIDTPVSLLRVSFGGAEVSLGGRLRAAKGQILPFKLYFHDGSTVKGDAEVRNIFYQDQADKTLVGLRFVHLDTNEARHLERMVNRLMRLER
jgi:hypothetical protein